MAASSPNTFAALAQPRPCKNTAQNAAPDSPEHGPARQKAVQLSKNLLSLKFMQRAVQKVEMGRHRGAATDAVKMVSLLHIHHATLMVILTMPGHTKCLADDIWCILP
jgi:hypothetical protein